MTPESLVDWLALRLLPGVGPRIARRALARFSDPGEVAFRLPEPALAEIDGIGPAVLGGIRAARRDLRRRAEDEVARAARLGVRLVPLSDPGYPAPLEQLGDAPTVLYVRGEIPPATVRIAVVGSRRATAYGRRVAAGLAAGLAERGVEIVSGGARGVDACAHQGCLEVGGRTLAVMGSGFARPYPAEHVSLFDRIASRGAVVSEFTLDEAPLPENFPRRNRLISGLSAAVVVVEATVRSGSLTTAGHALDQGKEVMAVPGPISSEQSEGCHRLIQQGAKLVQRLEDVLEELSPLYASALPGREPRPAGAGGTPPGGALAPSALTDDECAVLSLFDDPQPVHVDDLADRAPFGIGRLQVALFGLAFKGAVEQLTGGYYLAALSKPGR